LKLGQSNHAKEDIMNSIQSRNGSRNVALIAATTLLVAIAASPVVVDLIRTLADSHKPQRPEKITLTCFDRDMRAHSCDVVATTVAATRVDAK
jgi:hypothetical protein